MKNIKTIIGIYILLIAFAVTGCGKSKDNSEKKQETVATMQDATIVAPVTTEELTTEEELPKDEEGFVVTDDKVTVICDLANVMIKADESSGIYIYAEKGETLKRTGYNDRWTRVEIQSTSFYILSDGLEVSKDIDPVTTEGDDKEEEKREAKEKIIVIDPTNQASANVTGEEIGPGSETLKQRASSGIISPNGYKESELNLQYAIALKEELTSRGYTVILTRESESVDISNKERAKFANSQGASAYLRIMMNSSTNQELDGVMAITMTKDSPYNADKYDESLLFATMLLQGISVKTGAANRGIVSTDEMTAINFSKLPVVQLSLGFLSNETDEKNLTDDTYKEKMIKGIADGIDQYFNY